MSAADIYYQLLKLYPRRFRIRYAGEMLQVFRDCYGEQSNALVFWARTMTDLIISLGWEWRQEMILPDTEIDYTGLADSFMISVVVGTLLLGWGWTAAVIVFKLEPPANFVFGAVMTCALAVVIGVGCAKLVSRRRHTEPPPIVRA